MNIRSARDGDFADLARLHEISFAEAWDERALKGLIASGATASVAEQEGRIAGFILFRTASDEAEILTIAVAPDARRNGVGRALVNEAARAAAHAGATPLDLEVGANNAPARPLYAGLGFAKTGQRKGYYRTLGAAPEDALVLAAALPLSGLGNVCFVG
jgi:ribosomal-protein-alanine N-acetyltransferase